MSGDLYLGLDLSTQQLKGLVVNENLDPVYHAKVEFDIDLPEYKTVKGVYTNAAESEVLAPVTMWLDALDLLFERIVNSGKVDVKKFRGISGACQQHGSVFWNENGPGALKNLSGNVSLKGQLGKCFSWDLSPNWQDHSTRKECDLFESKVGGKQQLAQITGSKAHHRFTGPQILKVKNRSPDIYNATDRISLISSFLASVMLGKYAPVDVGDACGMNLWDINRNQWDEQLLRLIGDPESVKRKLGPVEIDGKADLGNISKYFVEKYGVYDQCKIIVFTGDNPGTILSLPLEPNDVIISLGTSTTALVVTEKYVPSSLYHVFSHPVDQSSYMGMLCYCNGALAREQVRNCVNKKYGIEETDWSKFDQILMNQAKELPTSSKVGFYFPLDEIIPDCRSGISRFVWDGPSAKKAEIDDSTWTVEQDVIKIVESQAMSIRHRLEPMLTTRQSRARRIYFVGGGSKNKALCYAMSNIFVPEEGAFTLDLSDACANGAANKAVYGCDRIYNDWKQFISDQWQGGRQAIEGLTELTDEYAETHNMFVKSEDLLLMQ